MTIKTYKELSLKQREQREGYLEDNKDKDKQKEALNDFTTIFSNDGKGSLIIDRNKDIKQTKWIIILWAKMGFLGSLV